MINVSLTREQLLRLGYSEEAINKAEQKQKADKLAAEQKALNTITFKVSPKGAVQVNGLQRYPVTLYKQQWRRLIKRYDDLLDFISKHENELVSKEESA